MKNSLNKCSIDQCRLIDLPKVNDFRGNLSFVEGMVHIPFDIKRAYYLYDVPAGAERGGHAHKSLEQLIVAVSGSFDVLLDDGINKKKVHLDRPFNGLYVGSMVWREMENFTSGAVCMVLASTLYEEEDYIRGYREFIKLARPSQ
ncbi:sugar 3,4-ketoisomerase [Arenicellales bacterium IMCC56312]